MFFFILMVNVSLNDIKQANFVTGCQMSHAFVYLQNQLWRLKIGQQYQNPLKSCMTLKSPEI